MPDADKTEVWGKRVALRGLVEISNICTKSCLYCGIRRGNAKTARYRMDEDEVFAVRKGLSPTMSTYRR